MRLALLRLPFIYNSRHIFFRTQFTSTQFMSTYWGADGFPNTDNSWLNAILGQFGPLLCFLNIARWWRCLRWAGTGLGGAQVTHSEHTPLGLEITVQWPHAHWYRVLRALQTISNVWMLRIVWHWPNEKIAVAMSFIFFNAVFIDGFSGGEDSPSTSEQLLFIFIHLHCWRFC